MSTLRDIAELANVSTATVSRVLNNDTTYKMTDATRSRVLDAAQQLNYKPRRNQKANSNTSADNHKSLKVGCVLSVTKDKYNDPFFMSILSSVESRLGSNGYKLSFLRTGLELEDNSTLYSTFNEDISGLILMETLNSDTYKYIRKSVPNIVGIDTKRDDIDNIGYDHYDAATTAVQHLIEKGHTRIGFIGGSGPTKNIKTSLRYRGYFTTMHAHGLDVNPDWVMDCHWDEAKCIELVQNLCLMPGRPTAIFVASDLMAMAALSGLYEIKVNVPSQMAVIGLSNIELSKYSNPPLTTIEVPTNEIGIVATDLLLARIKGYDLLPQKIILPSKLIVRDST